MDWNTCECGHTRLVREAMLFTAIIVLVLQFLTLLSVLVVFVPRYRVWFLIILTLGIVLLPFALVPAILATSGQLFTAADQVDIGFDVIAFSISNVLTMIFVLSLYWTIGFRLQKENERRCA